MKAFYLLVSCFKFNCVYALYWIAIMLNTQKTKKSKPIKNTQIGVTYTEAFYVINSEATLSKTIPVSIWFLTQYRNKANSSIDIPVAMARPQMAA